MLRALVLLTALVLTPLMSRSSFAASPATDSALTGRASGRLSADWRNVYYHGHHWYWMPDSSWRVWTDTGWAMPGIARLPEEYRRFSSIPSSSEMPRTFNPMSSNWSMGSSGGFQGGGAGPSMGNEHFLNR
jgi:hypothetical protein